MPAETHWRVATCEEVNCQAFAQGWITRVPWGSPQADLITSGHTGRSYQETTGVNTADREFMFAAGQACFAATKHRLPLDKPGLFVVRDGDWRGNPTGRRRVHANAVDWRDDMGEHLGRLQDQRDKG